MKFYEISPNVDKDVAGHSPQVNGYASPINFTKSRGLQWGIMSRWESEDDIPNLNGIKLHYHSKLTDYINGLASPQRGMFVSLKAFDALSNVAIYSGIFKDALIQAQNSKEPYKLLWYKSGIDVIDFKRSCFNKSDVHGEVFGEPEEFDTYDEYRQVNLELLRGPERLRYRPNTLVINAYSDLISLSPVADVLCSEKLKSMIENSNLTGFKFKEIDYKVIVHL